MAGRAALNLQPVTRCACSSPRRTPFRRNPALFWIRRKTNRYASCFSCSSLPEDRKSSEENSEETFQVLHQTEPGGYSLIRSVARLIDLFRVDSFDLEIMAIAVPAALALAADPLTSLVDTAFVGHLGSVELAAVGVSVSVFNLVSKLFNVPLLNITTSFVAEQEALDSKKESNIQKFSVTTGMMTVKKNCPAVSTSLSLAAAIGVVEALALSLGSGLLLNIMGIPFGSPMRAPAELFLTFRAYGAPPIVIALAAQGVFRGFMDTKTPLYAIGIGNILNAALDLMLIVFLGLGIKGAAIATVISEYVIALILLWKLGEKVDFLSPNFMNAGFIRYLTSGTLLISRTIAILLTMTLATSMAAREGPIQMAGHQICLQVWLAVSLLNDALALAAQALLASEYTKGEYEQARMVVYRVLQEEKYKKQVEIYWFRLLEFTKKDWEPEFAQLSCDSSK
ncbi:hypothetical protein HPP92_007564 [Vanilla planifolia]|uniref:Protein DETOXIFICATION n=1 Tax=Vanilla planifolia TaxID=51239 RepID=A0A835V8U3_VANPL|nr:hypothetical protein HPP92_007564 [Vanilla planifolia]